MNQKTAKALKILADLILEQKKTIEDQQETIDSLYNGLNQLGEEVDYLTKLTVK